MALGSMCRNRITGVRTPMAWAARTYSRLRQRRNSARTRSTRVIHENSSMIASRTQNPGTTKLEITMIR